ncbi:hypothetical protein LMF32_05460 [Desemzia sp. C1]|uniref:hypothetical protein n=1 Tax=Desemzia sp. C1 TaxID=2892016 RepID=UPI001E4BE1E0|nr:hypothetical protein [Desemzia sp. C1]MCI3028547.1 hypothetical protein [Desemzia sp. C1]
MTNEQINELQEKMERIGTKNGYSRALLLSIYQNFDGIVESANQKGDKEMWTRYEVERVAERTESLFNLLFELISDSTKLNDEVITQLLELKTEEV